MYVGLLMCPVYSASIQLGFKKVDNHSSSNIIACEPCGIYQPQQCMQNDQCKFCPHWGNQFLFFLILCVQSLVGQLKIWIKISFAMCLLRVTFSYMMTLLSAYKTDQLGLSDISCPKRCYQFWLCCLLNEHNLCTA